MCTYVFVISYVEICVRLQLKEMKVHKENISTVQKGEAEDRSVADHMPACKFTGDGTVSCRTVFSDHFRR